MNNWCWCVCLVLVGCGGSGHGVNLARGPDAVIASPLDIRGDLVWVVSRRTHDRAVGGPSTVDPRTLIAVASPDQATWLVAARLDAEAGLALSEAMSSTLRPVPIGQRHRLTLTVKRPLPGSAQAGQHVISGGGWHWMGMSTVDAEQVYTMCLIDRRGDQLAVVEMDAATARNLQQHLSRTLRAAPPRFAGGTDVEQTP